jgi:hypothetical protein
MSTLKKAYLGSDPDPNPELSEHRIRIPLNSDLAMEPKQLVLDPQH